MRVFILGFFTAIFVTAAAAQEVQRPEPDIEAVISGQMDAFLRSDVETAFGYASPSIRGMFGSAENFGAMVQRGYPMVWRPSDVQFGDLREIAGALWQQVIVTDSAGRIHALDYQMRKVEGEWRISAVQLLPAPDPMV